METPSKRSDPATETSLERRPTLLDVARLAQVSAATASRALNNPEMVSEETRLSVVQAAERAGYQPNLMARSLRKQQARAIVVLVPVMENPFYPEIIRGLEAAARDRDYSLLLGITVYDRGVETSYIDLVRNQRADGIVLLDGGMENLLEGGTRFVVPSVQVIERLKGVDLPWVGIDDRAAAMVGVQHLLDLGHRRIGHISGWNRCTVTGDRLAGYRAALRTAGIAYDPALVETGEFIFARGEAAAAKLMALPDPPTALFCANDTSALGALRHLHTLGLMVPRDVSIVGFDDIHLSVQSDPPLTTLHQPRFDIGFAAMTLLIDLLAGAPDLVTQQTLPVELVVRGSTAPPAGLEMKTGGDG
jgi:LacI family transcriptional regulator, repressor for deo operon, udp, cdd, tsx, nupC, and nupG